MATMSNSGAMNPILCTINGIPAEFLTRVMQAQLPASGEADCFFVIVDDLERKHDYDTKQFQFSQPSSSDTPFLNKSPEECRELLYQTRLRTGSNVDFNGFGMLDARSLKDDTILLVALRADRVTLGKVRSPLHLAWDKLMNYNGGKLGIEDDEGFALKSPDGVSRYPEVEY